MDLLTELRDVCRVGALADHGGPISCDPTPLFVAEAFPLGAFERGRLDEQPLAFVPPTRAAESHDDRAEGRVLPASPRQGHVPSGKEQEVTEVGAVQAKGLVLLHPQEAALGELRAALGADGRRQDVEDDDPLPRS